MPEWQQYERGMKAFCSCIGVQDTRDVLLSKCMQTAPRAARKLIHTCDTIELVDWRSGVSGERCFQDGVVIHGYANILFSCRRMCCLLNFHSCRRPTSSTRIALIATICIFFKGVQSQYKGNHRRAARPRAATHGANPFVAAAIGRVGW